MCYTSVRREKRRGNKEECALTKRPLGPGGRWECASRTGRFAPPGLCDGPRRIESRLQDSESLGGRGVPA
jgi:hypothetical protein